MSILKKIVDIANETEMGVRDSWEEYFMSKAYVASLHSTCCSRRVGAVVVDSLEQGKRKLLATGYNGNPPGDAHCGTEDGCPRYFAREKGILKSGEYSEEYPCFAFHAEANALYQMAQLGIPTKGCILFTTTFPCRTCAEKILGNGIKKIYYAEGYPDEFSRKYLDKYGVEYEKIEV